MKPSSKLSLPTLLSLVGLVGSLGLVLASPAPAAQVPFTGTLTVQVGGNLIVAGSGGGIATVNGSGGGHPITSLTLPASAFATVAGSATIPLNRTISVVNGGNCNRGAFDPSLNCQALSATLGGFGALQGNLAIPLSGIGGTTSTSAVAGQGWASAFVAAVGSPTSLVTFAYGSRSTDTGSNFNTDRITLVSPIRVNVGPLAGQVGIATISIHMVPEPSTVLLFLSGIAGLAGYGGLRRLR